jgi:hypothetical protein
MADGQDVACNYLRSNLLASYLDWAGLRIMTELEFEKCTRGPNLPVANEYPWGNEVIIFRTQLLNQSLPNELPADTLANINYANFNYQNDPSVVAGPMRNGAFAGLGRTRTESGAGYFGCMDLGGNVWEKIITVGNPAGRSYEGIHGNGLLTAAGRADVQSWPNPTTTIGFGLRAAGYFEPDYNFPRTSDRTYAAEANTATILANRGGRGCRTAPQ